MSNPPSEPPLPQLEIVPVEREVESERRPVWIHPDMWTWAPIKPDIKHKPS